MKSRQAMESCGYCLGAPVSTDPIGSHEKCPGRDCDCASNGHRPTPKVREEQRLFGHFATTEAVAAQEARAIATLAAQKGTRSEAPLGLAENTPKEQVMSDSVNLRALPGSLIATLPDGSEKVSFAGDWGSLKWKVRNWAIDNKVSVKKGDYDTVRDALRDAAAKSSLKRPVKVKIPTRDGGEIVFTYTPEADAKRKGGNKPARPAKKQPAKKQQPSKVSERAARRTVRAA